MIHTHHIRTILLTLAVCFPFLGTTAQTTKDINVSQENPYTDHLSLKDDSKDMDLMVKFIFNESNNTLSLYLISYRDLFVFQTDTPFKQAIRGKKLKPDKLPFVVDAEPGAKYTLSKGYYESIPKPQKKHTFKKWVEYYGVMPIPTEYKMVNDFVQQDFSILNDADAVTITLHDVMMMDQEATSKPTLKKRYDVVWGKDLDVTYHIYLERNPCLGKEDEIQAATKSLESIAAGYKNLANRFKSRIVDDKESLDNFKEMKKLLVGQFPAKDISTNCPYLQSCWEAYNQYVDSISSMRCYIRSSRNTGGGGSGNAVRTPKEGVNAGYILTQARRIDNAVSKWLASKDSKERSDLKKQCQDIVNVVKGRVAENGIINESQKNAMGIFNQAVRYYNTICK